MRPERARSFVLARYALKHKGACKQVSGARQGEHEGGVGRGAAPLKSASSRPTASCIFSWGMANIQGVSNDR